MIFENVVNNIEIGRKGENTGLSLGLNNIIDYIPNLQRGNIYLIGGETSSGKSMFAVNNFVYNPFEDWLENHKQNGVQFKAFIWSCEMDKHIVLTRAIARRLFKKYNILVDVNHILSRGKNRIHQEIYDKVIETKDYFAELEDRIVILGTDNPTGIRNIVIKYMHNHGKDNYVGREITNKDGSKETIRVFDRYIPDNENSYTICVVDHISLIKNERGFGKKEKIDKAIEYFIDLRDRYNCTPIIVQQLNRAISSTDRFKLNMTEVQLSDYKESSDTTDGANYVLGLFNPMRYEISPYRDYNTLRLANRFRSLKILKSRDGTADVITGLGFIGEVGQFFSLPTGKEMKEEDYKRIESLKKTYQ